MIYLVTATLNPGVALETFQASLNVAHGWYRFAPYAWAICTQEGSVAWTQRLQPFVRPRGIIFVCRLDAADRFGWMSNDFWHWLDEHASGP